MGIPADKIFPDEIEALRKRFTIIAEYSGMALREKKKSRSIVMEMIRCLLWHSFKSGIQAGIMMISPAHKPFFSFFGCEQIGGIRNACPGGDDPVILMYWNPISLLHKWNSPEWKCEEWENFLKHYLIEKNPYKGQHQQWEQEVRDLFSCPGAFSDILCHIPADGHSKRSPAKPVWKKAGAFAELKKSHTCTPQILRREITGRKHNSAANSEMYMVEKNNSLHMLYA
jgi:hypothetical protein